MNTNIIGISLALAVTITGGLFAATAGAVAASERSATQSSAHANADAMRRDACPYYPSPVVCGRSNASAD